MANAQLQRLHHPKIFYAYTVACSIISVLLLRWHIVEAVLSLLRFLLVAFAVSVIFLLGYILKNWVSSIFFRSCRTAPVRDFHVVITGRSLGPKSTYFVTRRKLPRNRLGACP